MSHKKTIRALVSFMKVLPQMWFNNIARNLIIHDLKARGLSISPTSTVQGSGRISCNGNSSVGAFSVIWCGNDQAGTLFNGKLEIGSNVYIGDQCNIRAAGCPIIIGNDVLIANGVTIVSANHGIKLDQLIRSQPWDTPGDQVNIGNDVWIGAHATILPGATISNGSIIAAGSVVRGLIPPNEIWGGIPARKLKDR